MKRSLFSAFLACAALVSCQDSASSLSGGSHGEVAYAHTEAILEFGPRPPESEALAQVRDYVSAELNKAGWQVRFQSFERETSVGKKSFVNVIARYGAEDSDELWKKPMTGILCAHIDSKLIPGKQFLGADDAASAVAAIVRIADTLHQEAPTQAEAIEIAFFDGEEAFAENMDFQKRYGLYGSWAYVAHWRLQPELPKFGILLDMVGHKDLKILLPGDSPKPLAKTLLAAAAAEGGAKHFSMGTGGILDDHVPLNLAGIPTIDMIGDFAATDWWHTEKDNLSLISEGSLDLSIRTVLRFLKERLAQ